MPHYFFDIYANGEHTIDDTGTECADSNAVRLMAIEVLPAIAKEQVVMDGDRQAFTVLVTDESGHPVYSATLNFAGLWLMRDTE